MVVTLPHNPPENSSASPCLAIDLYEASRPPRSQEYVALLMAVLAVQCAVYILSVPILFVLRNDGRFKKIRPFSLSAALMVVSVMFTIGCLVPKAFDGFPCALFLFLHVFASTMATTVTAARVLVFVIESQFAILVSEESSAIAADSSSGSVSRESKYPEGEFREDVFFAVSEALALGFGFRDLGKMSIHTLSQIRRRYLQIIVTISLPPFIVYFVSLLAIPAYRMGCTDCPVTIEFIMTVLASPTVFVILILRYLYLAHQMTQDEQRVRSELVMTLILSPAWNYIGYGLEIGDPNSIGFNRVFPWLMVTSFGTIFFWITTVLVQIIEAIKFRMERSRQKKSVSPDSPKSFVEELSLDPGLKKEFTTYASYRYTQENLNFLLDVRTFKSQFENGAEKWRAATVTKMIEVYIRSNAPQQINIGEKLREQITRAKIDGSNGNLVTLFDAAYQDILTMLTNGVWADFKQVRARKNMGGPRSSFIVMVQPSVL